MAFGVYVHIPYCLQICPYCDFTKYEMGKIMPPASYGELLAKEIRDRADGVAAKEIDTIYFGGGTPSLFEPSLILAILDELAKAGFRRKSSAELTIEIDPATVDESRLEAYLDIGINRFSVGAQTFHPRLLKVAGRKHSAQDTVNLLSLLARRNVNYSFDLLFGLPTQTLDELRVDVTRALEFAPSHLSAYCLTVPEGHPMAKNRAPDEEQVEMFHVIERELAAAGVLRYEISNFARPGHESRHNLLYWTDQTYWGLGTGAHSYFPAGASEELKREAPHGLRFWNEPSLERHRREIEKPRDGGRSEKWSFARDIPEDRRENLEARQALTDFCHTSLRMVRGLDRNALRLKHGVRAETLVSGIMDQLVADGLAERSPTGWALTAQGRVVANTAFERLTFLADEFPGNEG